MTMLHITFFYQNEQHFNEQNSGLGSHGATKFFEILTVLLKCDSFLAADRVVVHKNNLIYWVQNWNKATGYLR